MGVPEPLLLGTMWLSNHAGMRRDAMPGDELLSSCQTGRESQLLGPSHFDLVTIPAHADAGFCEPPRDGQPRA